MPNKGKNNRGQGRRQANGTMRRAPVAQQRQVRTRRPRMQTNPTSTIISHREFVDDIKGSVDFTINSFAVNPGINSLFPWLASIAQRYESYVFKKLSFTYSTVASTSTPGSIQLACDYDAADAPPQSKRDFMSYANAVRSAPWTECSYHSTTANLTKFAKERYVRILPVTGDIKTYDVANFFIATEGMADDSTIGELYVDYVVELRTPQTGVLGLNPPSLNPLGDETLFFTSNSNYVDNAATVAYTIRDPVDDLNCSQLLSNGPIFVNGIAAVDPTKSYLLRGVATHDVQGANTAAPVLDFHDENDNPLLTLTVYGPTIVNTPVSQTVVTGVSELRVGYWILAGNAGPLTLVYMDVTELIA